jgi:outer membrane protein OmpA-like peptidoglycan-associated protein
MNVKLAATTAVALGLAYSQQAHAQGGTVNTEPVGAEQPPTVSQRTPAPSNAFELTLGTGYTQGFGNLQQGVGMPSVATPGIGFDLGLGYRVAPRFSLAATAQYYELTAERATAARGLTAGANATLHMAPYSTLDPFLSLGAGYRMLWETHSGSPNLMTHGFELAKAQLGLDVRVSEDVAIAPVVGADLNLFLWQSGATNNVVIQDPRVNTFVFAGLQGRFDMGGHATSSGGVAKNEVVTPPPAPPPAPVPAPPPMPVPPPQEQTTPSLKISEDLIRDCRLKLDSEEQAPHFDFDKSDLKDKDFVVLAQIAKCFGPGGPLAGESINLVGHADPRGTEQYNYDLGMRRANTVGSYLQQLGVSADKINKTSRGKLDATGKDEAGWAKDRRVDVDEAK